MDHRPLAIAVAASLLAGCNCGVTAVSVAVSPTAPTVQRGATLQMSSTVTFSDGSHQDATGSGRWDVADTTIATVGNDGGAAGLVTGQIAGSTEVRFTYTDSRNGDRQYTAQAPLQVTAPAVPIGHWTWMGGSSMVGADGVYGTLGVPAAGNIPGARVGEQGWTASDGGLVIHAGENLYFFSDRWSFDGTSWTWMGGPQGNANQPPVYGEQGTPTAGNDPGSRYWSATWTDLSGNLWLFGGESVVDATILPWMNNDLWKFDGVNWTWVSGSNTPSAVGVYGTKGVADPANVPGARMGAASWVDASGNLWLFGGALPDISHLLNDLWRFDGVNWTWMGGSNTWNDNGSRETQGTPSSANIPSARSYPAVWVDASHQVWLFGGQGVGTGAYDDLWKFDGTSWTWFSGGTGVPVFGARGVADTANNPPVRFGAVPWTGKDGALWMFGGFTVSSGGTYGILNDLWRFDGARWAWMSGATSPNQAGTYGTLGSSTADTVPGARAGGVPWVDGAGHLWLFGGGSYAYVGPTQISSYFNDVWRYGP